MKRYCNMDELKVGNKLDDREEIKDGAEDGDNEVSVVCLHCKSILYVAKDMEAMMVDILQVYGNYLENKKVGFKM